MADERICFKPVENRAFELLFAEVREVKLAAEDGGKQDRIADPAGKIADIFSSLDEAKAFIAKLNVMGLFQGALPCGSVRVDSDRWVVVDDLKKVVDDSPPPSQAEETVPIVTVDDPRLDAPVLPPLDARELVLTRLRGEYQHAQTALRERRDALKREMASVKAQLAEFEAIIAKLDRLLEEERSLGERILEIIGGNAATHVASS